ncbi:hypothetical protein [Ammoniphilus sp. CFH 90114]|nr:hypothetical protein [Ammoniphilus sp. CFH 90114]
MKRIVVSFTERSLQSFEEWVKGEEGISIIELKRRRFKGSFQGGSA